MSDKRLKHTLFTKAERAYWRNVHVNVDSICDYWDEYQSDALKYLSNFSDQEFSSICNLYSLPKIRPDKKSDFLTHQKEAIDFLCAIHFASINPKAISQFYKIPIGSGKIDKNAVYLRILEENKRKNLPQLFLMLRKQKLGKGGYNFNFDKALTKTDYQEFEELMPLVVRQLKRADKEGKEYHYRSSSYADQEWNFLILKETSDVIIPAIPDNARVLKGDYILITIHPASKALEVNTRSKNEAYKIRQYLSKKTDNKLRYEKKFSTYNPKKFFDEIITESKANRDLKLYDVEFKDSNLHTKLRITDSEHKNNILAQLQTLKNKGILKLEDFSEFKSLSFLFKDINFKVIVEESRWGQLKLNLIDRGKPKNELEEFKDKFESLFKVPLNNFLKHANSTVDQKKIARRLFERNTIEANIPKEVEEILLDLIDLKLAAKPHKAAKRRCIKCHKLTWGKGDCPECGNDLLIEGDYIDLKSNIKGIQNWIGKFFVKQKELKAKRVKRQIDSAKFDFIEVRNPKGEFLSIFIAPSNVPEKVIKHFQETGSPLLVVLIKFKEALHNDIVGKGFECVEVSDFYVHKSDKKKVVGIINSAIETQNEKWQEKITQKGYQSFKNIEKKSGGYTDQDFEKDIYNLFHEIFLIGDRLGGKFAGIPAPDGIVSVQNYSKPLSRFCFAWDCKYSVTTKGYQLSDKPEKHRRYIYSLKRNGKVLFYGGLGTYGIISQNMDMKKYEEFYVSLTNGARWKGSVVFIHENDILHIYKYFKKNEALIKRIPDIFYKEVFKLLKVFPKRDSKPYKHLSKERMLKFMESLSSKYKGKGKKFVFNRSEF